MLWNFASFFKKRVETSKGFPSIFDVISQSFLQIFTVGENIIVTKKIQNNNGAIQSFIFPILR